MASNCKTQHLLTLLLLCRTYILKYALQFKIYTLAFVSRRNISWKCKAQTIRTDYVFGLNTAQKSEVTNTVACLQAFA